MYYFFIYLILMVVGFVIIYSLLGVFSKIKLDKKIKTDFNIVKKIEDQLLIMTKKRLIPPKLKFITPVFIISLMFVIFIISFSLFYSYLKVISTALILSLPFSISPIIIIRLYINKEKNSINRLLPMYAVNLKNHVSEDNNIIKAIQMTSVEEPLEKYIDKFTSNIKRGLNVIQAFEDLKNEVNIKNFDYLINSCETCYLNGGDFVKVLEQYINITTKENTEKESSKEKAYSDMLTLIIMVILNIFVVVCFVLANKDYAYIIRSTFVGRAILSLNALSYLVIAYLVSKMYKEE